MKKIFRGVPLPQIFKRHFACKSKSRITFERQEINEKFRNRPTSNRGYESNGDVTPGLTSPLAAEIVIQPFSARRKALNETVEDIDGKCQQNTNRKPWSLSNAPRGRNRQSAITDHWTLIEKLRSTNRFVTSFLVSETPSDISVT
jgi:hypothetical protein